MDAPFVEYARTEDGVNIACWKVGQGPPLLYLEGGPSAHAELIWEVRNCRAFFELLAGERTLHYYDPRGSGLSDASPDGYELDSMLLDIDAVANHFDLEQFAMLANGGTASLPVAYAGTRRERVTDLVAWHGFASVKDWESDSRFGATMGLIRADWALWIDTMLPKTYVCWSDDEVRPSLRRLFLGALSQERMLELNTYSMQWDATEYQSAITARTLVVRRRDCEYFPVGPSRSLTAQIPAATFRGLPGSARSVWDEDFEGATAVVLDFFAARTLSAPASSLPSDSHPFRTILFTDVVASTPLLAQLKDEKMRAVMRDHDEVLEAAITENGGRVVKTIGDAFMAEFAVPSAAVDAAIAAQRGILDKFADSDVPIRLRIGINAGEPIEEDGDLHGASVVIAKRLESEAENGGILVSDVVRSAVAGKEFEFIDRGEVSLKGFAEPVRAWSVEWE